MTDCHIPPGSPQGGTFSSVRRIGWDTETTGPNPLEDRIVTAAIVMRGGGLPDRNLSWLINPGIPIPPDATAVHGIDDARAQAEGADPKQALDEIAHRIAAAIVCGFPVIAFNTSFDWSILHYDLVRHGLPTVEDRVGDTPLTLVDPHVIDKQCVERIRGKGQRKLQPTAERYGVKLTDWHTAEADALAALLIADAQFDRYRFLNNYGPKALHAAQKVWRAEQSASLQDYFRGAPAAKGGDPDAVVDGSWPLISAPRGGE